LRDQRFVLLRRVLMSNIGRVRPVFQQALELVDHSAQRKLSLKAMLTRHAKIACRDSLAGGSHFAGGAVSTVSEVMSEPFIFAAEPLQSLRQLGGFFAQLIFFLGDLGGALRLFSLIIEIVLLLPLVFPLTFVGCLGCVLPRIFAVPFSGAFALIL